MANYDIIHALVIDNSALYRKVISDILGEIEGIEVVGSAPNGKIAFSKLPQLKPDLIILDLLMPEMDGIEFLSHLRDTYPDTGVVILSEVTNSRNEKIAINALAMGIFDFIIKPQKKSMEESRQALKDAIFPIIKAFIRLRQIKGILKPVSALEIRKNSETGCIVRYVNPKARDKRIKSKIVAIGISTGGPNALLQMMPRFPHDLGVPILIVQHIPASFTLLLAEKLSSLCAIEVRVAVNKEPLRPDTAFLAPGGKQMKIAPGKDGEFIILITDDPSENNCKPSADYLFRSIAQHFGPEATGVVMTGMGSDGTLGLKEMKEKGAVIIAQDEASCVVYGMPKGVVDAGIADVIAPLDRIAGEICRTLK